MSVPNWLGDATVSIPNNTLIVNGNAVNAVPVVLGGSSNVTSWPNANYVTYWTSPVLSSGTYLVGMENFCDPINASNVSGWAGGDGFVARIIDKDALATRSVQYFVRPYYNGLQTNASSPWNLGSTNQTTTGIVVLNSNTNIVWQVSYVKDAAVSYPQTRGFTVESPWYMKIA